MLIKLGIGALAATLGLSVGAGVAVQQYGTAVVHVQEKGPGGASLVIPVPLALARVALGFIPVESLQHSGHDLRLASQLVSAVTEELSKYPDTVFVQIEEAHESVLVHTTDESLVVEVDSPDERVRVRVPLWGACQLLEVLAERAAE